MSLSTDTSKFAVSLRTFNYTRTTLALLFLVPTILQSQSRTVWEICHALIDVTWKTDNSWNFFRLGCIATSFNSDIICLFCICVILFFTVFKIQVKNWRAKYSNFDILLCKKRWNFESRYPLSFFRRSFDFCTIFLWVIEIWYFLQPDPHYSLFPAPKFVFRYFSFFRE